MSYKSSEIAGLHQSERERGGFTTLPRLLMHRHLLPIVRKDLTAGYTYLTTKCLDDPARAGNVFEPRAPKHSLKFWPKYTFDSAYGYFDGVSLRADAHRVILIMKRRACSKSSEPVPQKRRRSFADNYSERIGLGE